MTISVKTLSQFKKQHSRNGFVYLINDKPVAKLHLFKEKYSFIWLTEKSIMPEQLSKFLVLISERLDDVFAYYPPDFVCGAIRIDIEDETKTDYIPYISTIGELEAGKLTALLTHYWDRANDGEFRLENVHDIIDLVYVAFTGLKTEGADKELLLSCGYEVSLSDTEATFFEETSGLTKLEAIKIVLLVNEVIEKRGR